MVGRCIKRLAILLLVFVIVSAMAGGKDFRWVAELTGLRFLHTLADKADFIREQAASITGFIDERNRSEIEKLSRAENVRE